MRRSCLKKTKVTKVASSASRMPPKHKMSFEIDFYFWDWRYLATFEVWNAALFFSLNTSDIKKWGGSKKLKGIKYLGVQSWNATHWPTLDIWVKPDFLKLTDQVQWYIDSLYTGLMKKKGWWKFSCQNISHWTFSHQNSPHQTFSYRTFSHQIFTN